MMHLILALIALAMLWYLLQTLLWVACWLSLQPIRLVLWVVNLLRFPKRSSRREPTPFPERGGANIIPFRRPS